MTKKNGKKSVTTIPGLARLMQEEFLRVHNRLGNVETDVGTLKTDVGTLKGDMGVLKEDVGTLKGDVGILKLDMHEVKRDLREMKEKSSELFLKLDKFITLYQETKQELTVMAKQLRRLEERVAHLEGKR